MIIAFLVASLVLAVTPGPAVVYLLARTFLHGRRAGFASLAGVALGNFGNALGASIGLAALFAVSSVAFTVVKIAGALYLIYLGFRTLKQAPVGQPVLQARPYSNRTVFRDGFLVALLNPKTALFFAAFLPQFIDPSASAVLQSVMLGGLFVVVAAATDAVYVMLASRISPYLGGGPQAAGEMAAGSGCAENGRQSLGFGLAGRYLSAATFFGLGIYTALSGPRAPQ